MANKIYYHGQLYSSLDSADQQFDGKEVGIKSKNVQDAIRELKTSVGGCECEEIDDSDLQGMLSDLFEEVVLPVPENQESVVDEFTGEVVLRATLPNYNSYEVTKTGFLIYDNQEDAVKKENETVIEADVNEEGKVTASYLEKVDEFWYRSYMLGYKEGQEVSSVYSKPKHVKVADLRTTITAKSFKSMVDETLVHSMWREQDNGGGFFTVRVEIELDDVLIEKFTPYRLFIEDNLNFDFQVRRQEGVLNKRMSYGIHVYPDSPYLYYYKIGIITQDEEVSVTFPLPAASLWAYAAMNKGSDPFCNEYGASFLSTKENLTYQISDKNTAKVISDLLGSSNNRHVFYISDSVSKPYSKIPFNKLTNDISSEFVKISEDDSVIREEGSGLYVGIVEYDMFVGTFPGFIITELLHIPASEFDSFE